MLPSVVCGVNYSSTQYVTVLPSYIYAAYSCLTDPPILCNSQTLLLHVMSIYIAIFDWRLLHRASRARSKPETCIVEGLELITGQALICIWLIQQQPNATHWKPPINKFTYLTFVKNDTSITVHRLLFKLLLQWRARVVVFCSLPRPIHLIQP